jgi:hypothetical protein
MRKFNVAAATLLLLACHEPTQPDPANRSANVGSLEAKRWVVVFNQHKDLPKDVDRLIANAGGVITTRLREIGAIGASSSDPGFAAKVAADPQVKAVSEDIQVQMIPDLSKLIAASDLTGTAGPTEPTGPDPQPMPDNFGFYQWDKMRMNATLTGSYAVQRGRRDVVVAIQVESLDNPAVVIEDKPVVVIHVIKVEFVEFAEVVIQVDVHPMIKINPVYSIETE